MVEYVKKTMKEIVTFIDRVIEKIDYSQVDRMIRVLEETDRSGRKVLVMGAGRSGLVGRAFAMRLMHLGFNVYVLGETITPSIGKGDVVVAISGSGRTQLIVTAAEAAKKVRQPSAQAQNPRALISVKRRPARTLASWTV